MTDSRERQPEDRKPMPGDDRSQVTRVLLPALRMPTPRIVEDIVVEDIALTRELKSAIEQKMVQEQEAARARFAQQQAEVEASTAVIKAKGEAQSINLRGKALMENPSVLDLQVVEKWDGIVPMVVGPHAAGANVLLPLQGIRTNQEALR